MDPETESIGTPDDAVVRDVDRDVHIGTTIVSAVSEASGVPVAEMGVELNDVVDPDALNHLFADRLDGTPRLGGRVVFSMIGHVVTVSSDGTVTVTADPELEG
jgi:hypothetical protein